MKIRIALLLALAAVLALPVAATATGGSTPAVGTPAEQVDLSTVDGAAPFEGGYAVPLKGETPSWYTDELAARVHAACTMNFVFQRSGAYGIGTAGHCTDSNGQSVVLLTVAPGGSNPVLVDIGTVNSRRDVGIGNDFALVSIRPQLNAWVFATTAVVGGPCGTYTGPGPETVWHSGHGLAIGTGGTPRAGVGLRWGTNEFGWAGAAIFGDSGSPVRVGTGLRAAGDLTHLIVDTRWLPNYIAGTRISRMLSIAGGGWSLVSSPLCV